MMRKFSKKKLTEILRKHKLWLNGEDGGEKANLSGADLHGTDLRRVDLCKADLSEANLSEANLSGADLSLANLSRANLSKANLSKAGFYETNLFRVDLYEAKLRKADLSEANLSEANLSGADLSNADLSGANLHMAYLRIACLFGADLFGADLSDADLLCTMACPDEGSFIGWKKVPGPYIVKLYITKDAKRSSATGRKCRCNKAKVISIENLDGTPSDVNSICSAFDPNFIYEIGSEVYVDDFDENRFNECTSGIHFFITRQEAVNYIL